MKKRLRFTVIAFAAYLPCTQPAPAQDWPTRPLTMIVPFGAGGASDVIGRLIAEGLRTTLGQPVVIENVGGAGGMTGANRVAKAPPDGVSIRAG